MWSPSKATARAKPHLIPRLSIKAQAVAEAETDSPDAQELPNSPEKDAPEGQDQLRSRRSWVSEAGAAWRPGAGGAGGQEQEGLQGPGAGGAGGQEQEGLKGPGGEQKGGFIQ